MNSEQITVISPETFQGALAAARAHASRIERELSAAAAGSRRKARTGADGRWPVPAEGWFQAPYDPNELLRYFPRVRLKADFRLDAYQYMSGANGNGFVFAVPADQRLPEPPAGLNFGWVDGIIPAMQEKPPLPDWARRDIEAFLEPDGSPASYFDCSLLIRELQELGAVWHGGWWSTHEIVTGIEPYLQAPWEWIGEPPRLVLPQVRLTECGTATVQFYTVTRHVQEQMYCHTDTYEGGTRTRSQMQEVAVGGVGYIY